MTADDSYQFKSIAQFDMVFDSADTQLTQIDGPQMAESGPSISANFYDLNVRFGEKPTLHCYFRNAQNNAKYLSVRMSAFPCKADIKLNLGKRSANDPKRTLEFGNILVKIT